MDDGIFEDKFPVPSPPLQKRKKNIRDSVSLSDSPLLKASCVNSNIVATSLFFFLFSLFAVVGKDDLTSLLIHVVVTGHSFD